jgi:hypothetical protein
LLEGLWRRQIDRFGDGFRLGRGASYYHSQGENQDAEKAVAGDQKDHLPGIKGERIAATLRGQISDHRFFFWQIALALSKAKPIKQHHMPSLPCLR